MSSAAADGAWVFVTRVSRIDCDKCGIVHTSRYPMNDREEDEFILKHMRDKHNGTHRAPPRKP
jgi:hypothetical protein